MADGRLTGLDAFLREAKAVTYASGQNKAPATRPGSEDYHYEHGEWVYHDCFWGGNCFIGHELVWQGGKPIWGMNYYGGATSASVDTRLAYTVLKQALLALDDTIIPVRGPASFTQHGLHYANAVTGDLTNFEAVETVAQDRAVLCRHKCQGGLIL